MMKVALDIGHCSTGDQGAVSRDGLAEHPFWAQYTPAIVRELEKLGHQVRVFRREDYSRSIKNECVAINAWGADVAVSLHLNSADSPACKGGHEVVHYDGSKKGIALAKTIDAQFDLIAELADRNIRTPYANRGDVFLQGTVCPAVIVEGAFLSVESDVKFIRKKGEVLAQAVAHGIHAYAVQCGA
jgi:N-acetylmuramoyl-L-alanine amidase